MMKPIWTAEDVDKIVLPVLARHPYDRRAQAIAEISRLKGRDITESALRNLILRHRGTSRLPELMKRQEPAAKAAGRGGEFEELLELTRKGPTSLEEICDRLDLSPARARGLVGRAQGAGYLIDVTGDTVSFRPSGPREGVQESGVAPTTGKRQMIGVASDLHFGSKHCMRSEIRDFVEHAYRRGVRDILIPGDILDGVYKFSLYEQSHRGFEEQAQDAIDGLPRKKGLTYHFIGGNHDQTFTEEIGIECGKILVSAFRDAGRDDLRYYGERRAFVRVRGITIEMWHPKGGGSYALSYKLQNHIRDYAIGEKPDLLLMGHFHVACYLEQRGVHACACPCFQGPGSSFSKSLGGSPAMGGLILSWETTAHGTVRRFELERSSYYVDERPRDLESAA